MAVLVRAAGVPARVAFGYTPGSLQPDGSRVITSDDAHAWVEVYFQSLGWVPFDPTPIAAARAVTLPWAPRADAPTGAAAGAAAPAPTAAAAAAPTTRTDRAADGAPVARQSKAAAGTPWPLLAGAGAALVALLALATPAGAAPPGCRRRLAGGTAVALWDELEASALDIGVRLQPSWTPRHAAQELAAVVARAGGDGAGTTADAVARLARAEEVACYGPPGGRSKDPELVAALRTARRGLLHSVSRDRRLRAAVWPASLVTGAAGRSATRTRRWVRTIARPRRPRVS
jgi:hypothetical protein